MKKIHWGQNVMRLAALALLSAQSAAVAQAPQPVRPAVANLQPQAGAPQGQQDKRRRKAGAFWWIAGGAVAAGLVAALASGGGHKGHSVSP